MNKQSGRQNWPVSCIDRDVGCRILLSEQSGSITEQLLNGKYETGSRGW